MKKFVLILFAAVLVASCEGPAGPIGPPGPPGETGEPGAYWKVRDFDINKWDSDAEGGFFLKHFSFPDLTSDIYNNGVAVAYIEFEGTYQTPLPYTRYRQEIINDETYLWSELIDFEYSPGGITFYLTPSDFNTFAEIPAPTLIRVVLLW